MKEINPVLAGWFFFGYLAIGAYLCGLVYSSVCKNTKTKTERKMLTALLLPITTLYVLSTLLIAKYLLL